MTERIAEEKLNEIRQAVDIVDVIADYVQLKKQGRNYFGLCPFHGENTPSFSVSPDKQIYHCFGCGAGGNVFSFLMELEGLSFQEAAVRLAKKANVELEIHPSGVSRGKSIPKDTQMMVDAHDVLRKFYHHLLVNTKDGQHALEYLLNRGFTLESIDKFQIGYALKSWDFIYKFLIKRNFQPEILEKAGLIIKRERDGTYFDRFRDRIMFPIFDQNGNTIAFSGRSLGAEEPKYLNSPETAIFNKSKILYNYHLARPIIKKLQEVVLFEGFADVIAADKAGVENGVASMGTSLTSEHVSIIRRNVQTVTICYDSDNAGIEAAYRAGNMLSESGCRVKVALMPDGMDPDEYINKFGGDKYKNEVIHSSKTWMAFKLYYLRKGKNLNNEGDRLLYIEEVLKEISRLEMAVERDLYLRQLATEFSLSLEALKLQQKQIYYNEKRKNQGKAINIPKQRIILEKQNNSLKPAFHNAERYLLAYMLKDEDLAFRVQERLQGHTFNIDEHQAIFTYLLGYYTKGLMPNAGDFINYVEDPKLKRIIAEIEMLTVTSELTEQELADYLKQVLNYPKLLKIKEKEAEGRNAERSDPILAAKIAKEIMELRKEIHS
ncbi:DNA primase [Bacillus massilinigeriensis]|uniref:DNA primase n=1 Tax=Bacillus massilionigeriensis TaxID=1805475 RepID=UPI00096B12EE|nr:DNA primase [Bacillus massilionigeriensis]